MVGLGAARLLPPRLRRELVGDSGTRAACE